MGKDFSKRIRCERNNAIMMTMCRGAGNRTGKWAEDLYQKSGCRMSKIDSKYVKLSMDELTTTVLLQRHVPSFQMCTPEAG
jgi:hypothetical protein